MAGQVRFYPCIKRIIDIVVSFSLLMFFFPLLVMVSIALVFSVGWPVFFRQTRPGFKGKPFNMVKFKTMSDAKDKHGQLLPDIERITFLGKLLRKTSIDELPELWHVFIGQMSLIGPRPLLMEYLPRYSRAQFRRHDVKPGITGLAQVSGRNTLDWDTRFELDVYYVDHYSFMLDIKILWLTVKKVIQAEGIQEDANTTMTKFKGQGDDE